MRMCGPALGYFVASKILKVYIDPSLTPTITTEDPRWMGAWWLGWLIFSVPIFITAICFGTIQSHKTHFYNLIRLILVLFPKTLPRAAVRKSILEERQKREFSEVNRSEEPTSLKGKYLTNLKPLLDN